MKYVVSLIVSLIALMMDAMPTKNAYAAKHIMNVADEIPYECEVQWLESTGTQYILLEDVLANGIDIYVLPQKERAMNSAPFGRWNGGARSDSICFTTINNRGWSIQNMNITGLFTFDMTYEMKHVVVCGTSILIDDAEYSMGNEWGSYGGASKYCFAMFGCYNQNAGTVTCQSCKIGRCDLYVNNELAYSFIPVRVGVGKDAIGFMYE